jgi:hypothetical protein
LRVRFQPDLVVDSVVEALFASQVPFRRLHRDVPQKELNLLQFTTGLMAKPGASPAAMPNTGSCRIIRIELREQACLSVAMRHNSDILTRSAIFEACKQSLIPPSLSVSESGRFRHILTFT